MPIRPTPIQVIRSRFNEITLWRSQGNPWSEISNELQVHANTLSILYQRELKRRTTPQYITATRWVSAHHDTIAELLARGFTWVSITNLIPVVPESNEAMPTLEMLVVEYGSITASHASGASPHRVPEPEPTSQLIPQAAAPVDPSTQQGTHAFIRHHETEHESPTIRIPSGGHEVKTMDMSIKPTPIQLVRSHFHKIAQWRSQGIPWAQIGDELKLLNITISTGTLRTLYRQERLRHGSPGYIAATQWVTTNRIAIAERLNKGVDWGTIIAIVPPDNASDGKPPKLEMLIEAYTSIVDRTAPSPAPTPLHQSDAEPDSPSPFHRVM